MSQAPVFICAVPTVNSLVQEVRQQHLVSLKPSLKEDCGFTQEQEEELHQWKSGLRWYCHPPSEAGLRGPEAALEMKAL